MKRRSQLCEMLMDRIDAECGFFRCEDEDFCPFRRPILWKDLWLKMSFWKNFCKISWSIEMSGFVIFIALLWSSFYILPIFIIIICFCRRFRSIYAIQELETCLIFYNVCKWSKDYNNKIHNRRFKKFNIVLYCRIFSRVCSEILKSYSNSISMYSLDICMKHFRFSHKSVLSSDLSSCLWFYDIYTQFSQYFLSSIVNWAYIN